MTNISIDEALIIRYFSDDITTEEWMAVNNWIEESEENQHIAEQIYYIKYAGDTVHAIRSTDTRTDLNKVWKKIRKRSTRLRAIWMQAASVACLFFIPAVIYLQFRNNDSGLSGVVMSVPEGSISSMVLPDGSKVWLNAGSQLSYDNGYGISNRRMYLSGEGFFEVSANNRLPFEVDADALVIRAMGTKFNVKAYPDEHTVTAILTEGVIEIISAGGQGQKKTISQPGQMVVHNKSHRQLAVEPVEDINLQKEKKDGQNLQLTAETIVQPELYTSWKDQRWLIEGTTLGELAPILQRRYAVKFVFDNDALKTYKFRGEISNISVEQMAKALELTAPMNYRMSNDTVFFTIDLKRKKEFDQYVK